MEEVTAPVRQDLLVDRAHEDRLLHRVCDKVWAQGYDASNTAIVTVSTDYSSVVGQFLRHQLTAAGEICVGFGVDVPYPDQLFDAEFTEMMEALCRLYHDSVGTKTLLLVEAGVIRGGNYAKVVEIFRRMFPMQTIILTLTLFENIHSQWKSDVVGEYYDDTTHDLTFWWEQPNIHWAR